MYAAQCSAVRQVTQLTNCTMQRSAVQCSAQYCIATQYDAYTAAI